MSIKNPYKRLKTDQENVAESVINCHINMLDYDSLATIFLYLPFQERLSMEKVCEKWNIACQRAWSDIKSFDSEDNDFIEKHFKKADEGYQDQVEVLLTRCGLYLKHLILKKNYDSQIVPIIKRNCPNLLRLELEVTDDDCEAFIGAFSDMKSLEYIAIMHRNADDDYSNNYRNILESLPESVECLCYDCEDDDYPDISDEFAETISRLNSLRCVVLRGWSLDENLISNLTQKESIIQLNFETSEFNQARVPISKLKNLVSLNLAGMGKTYPLCDDDMIDIINNCNQIKLLNIRRCTALTDRSLTKLDNLKHLEGLVIDHTLAKDSVFGVFPNLKCFECMYCHVTDFGIMKLLSASPNLVKLDVCWTDITIETIKYASDMTKRRENRLDIYIDKILSFKHSELIDDYQSRFLNIDDETTSICVQLFCVLFRLMDHINGHHDSSDDDEENSSDDIADDDSNDDENSDDEDSDDENSNTEEEEDDDGSLALFNCSNSNDEDSDEDMY